MARVMVPTLVVLALSFIGMAKTAEAQSEETAQLAAEHDLAEQDLRAAADTVGVSARRYLEGEGVLSPPSQRTAQAVAPGQPPGAAVSAAVLARVKCLEYKESGGANVANRA